MIKQVRLQLKNRSVTRFCRISRTRINPNPPILGVNCLPEPEFWDPIPELDRFMAI